MSQIVVIAPSDGVVEESWPSITERQNKYCQKKEK